MDDPGILDPRDRPPRERRRCTAVALPTANVRRGARGQPHPVDRQGRSADGQTPRRVERHCGDEQDPRAGGELRQSRPTALCVRVGAMSCHSQAITIRLKRDVPLAEIEAAASRASNDWVKVDPEQASEASIARTLTPAAGQRYAHGPDRPDSGRCRWAKSSWHGVHARRPAPVGRGGADPAHVAYRRRGAAVSRRGAAGNRSDAAVTRQPVLRAC
jgi:hypothetical protein